MRGLFLLIVSLLLPLCGCSNEDSVRVLFVGNSYTGQVKKTLLQVLKNSPDQNAEFEFITPGGCTLERHLDNEETLSTIRSGGWDFVVLQEQSQTPALPGDPSKSFHRSVAELCRVIRGSGAEPVLYMTWGRRDGDSHNPDVFPDYETMQEELTAAYRKASSTHGARLAPVGEVWSNVREANETLGTALYKKDGSHPATPGAYLASLVILRTLFGEVPDSIEGVEGIDSVDAGVIQSALK